MIKTSYWSKKIEESKPAKDKDVPISMPENDVSAEGANGFNALEMGIEGFGQDPDSYKVNKGKKLNQSGSVEGIIDLLVELGDLADEQDEYAFADFADFLLIKYAETKSDDPTLLFNQLMIKIVNADLPNTNDVLKKLAKIYSRTILLEYPNHNNLNKAKESAYKKVVMRTSQYMTEF